MKSKILIFVIMLFVTHSANSMETLGFSTEGAGEMTYDELSPCGQKIAEFKFFMRDAKRCIRDTDCTVIPGECPLGCRFYINKNFATIISNRIEEVSELCEGSVCSAVCPDPSTWDPATCTENGKCVADI